ncbi:unnamed protein product, partial [Onchocerca ochengi]|uniref:ATP-dependent DNA helicase n=1 Tax=Onchocerca ochengi TaxID=42157 RepID=A0A182EQU6_ONCOC
MPSLNRSAAASELRREQNYNTSDLLSYIQSNIPGLTFGQKDIYDQIMKIVSKGVGEIFFLDAPRGGGDYRRTLPVIPRSIPTDEINDCLKYSTLWRHIKTLKLTTNMRIQMQNNRSAGIFLHQLLETGNEKMP